MCDDDAPLIVATKSGGSDGKQAPISFLKALKIPGVLPYASAFACFKLITYTFYFWLPTYLSQVSSRCGLFILMVLSTRFMLNAEYIFGVSLISNANFVAQAVQTEI